MGVLSIRYLHSAGFVSSVDAARRSRNLKLLDVSPH